MPVVVALPEEIAALAEAEGTGMDRAVVEAVVWRQYQRGRISAGKSAELLGMSRGEFEAQRMTLSIPLPFSEEELEQDLAWAAEAG